VYRREGIARRAHIGVRGNSLINALPPPEILAHLTGPQSTCVISLTYTDEESGNVTSARCGKHRYVLARDYHGDSVRRINSCTVMLMIEGVRFPRLLHLSNCDGPLRVRHTGETWTRELLAAGRIAPRRLDRALFDPVAGRPTCYRVWIAFTALRNPPSGPLGDRSTVRCDNAAGHESDTGVQRGDER
jgi:hypothetical protein